MKKSFVYRLIAVLLICGIFAGSVFCTPVITEAKSKTPGISSTKLTLNAGKTKLLKVTNTKEEVKWTSSDKKVVSVSKAGLIKAKKEGKATITAKVGKTVLKCKVTVKASLNKTNVELLPGEKINLKVNGTSKKIKWTSSNNKIASVSSKGIVKAKKAGNVTISAKYGNKQLKCKIKVVKKRNALKISFTNSGIQANSGSTETRLGLIIKKDNITVKGTISTTALKSFRYTLKNGSNKEIASGDIQLKKKWSVKLKPDIGVNILTVIAESSSGKRKETAVLYITRLSEKTSLNENVVTGDKKESRNFGQKLVSMEQREVVSDGVSVTHTKVTINKNSNLYKKVTSGELKKGMVYTLEPSDELPGGFTGVITSIGSPFGDNVEIGFREPAWTELFGEKGNLKIDKMNQKDPLAFVLLADGTDALDPDSVNASYASDGEEYKTKAFPEGIKSSLKLKTSTQSDKTNIEFSLKDLIIYDFDGKKSTKDTIKFDGSIVIKDLHVDFYSDWDGFSLNQLYLNLSHKDTVKGSLTFNGGKDSWNLKGIVKDANDGFENKAKTLFGLTEYAGIDMSNRLLLGVVAINTAGIQPVDNLKTYSQFEFLPTILVAVYLDLQGTVTLEGKVSVQYEAYYNQGLNVLKNNYPTLYPSFDNASTLGNHTISCLFTKRKSETNHDDPEAVFSLGGEACGEIRLGAGFMAGVLIGGVIPADVYVNPYGKINGKAKGALELHCKTKEKDLWKGKAEAEATITCNLDFAAELGVSVKKDKGLKKIALKYEGELKKSFLIWELTLDVPKYDMSGNVYKNIPDGSEVKDAISGAQLRLYDMEKNGIGKTDFSNLAPEKMGKFKEYFNASSGDDGSYKLTGLKNKDYILLVSMAGYEPIFQKISISGDIAKDIYLTGKKEPVRTESDNPGQTEIEKPTGTGVKSVSAGYVHTAVVKADGTLWMSGWNYHGELGDGTKNMCSEFKFLMKDVRSVSAGNSHTAILKTDGTLWVCGYRYGSTPVKAMSDVRSVSAGRDHTAILKTDGTLWMGGDNTYGQLGDGTNIEKSCLKPVKVMENVQSVSAGSNHTAILKTDGTLWMCGSNYFGELGNGETTGRKNKIKIMSDVRSVSAGGSHTAILKTDGTLWICGSNFYSESGEVTTQKHETPVQIMENVKSVDAGSGHTAILKTDGTLWMYGWNGKGELGDGTNNDRSKPVKIMDDVQSVSTGEHFTMILKMDGSLWACGMNEHGELGDGTNVNRNTPVKIMD